jgi:large subunit ribosomal protein L17
MLTRKFGRRLDHRRSLLRNLACSVILYERVVTTTAKAKEICSLVERLINIGKRGRLEDYRRLRQFFFEDKAAKKIVEDLAPRYHHLNGGYVTISYLPPRKSDNAPMSLVELRPATTPASSDEATDTKKDVETTKVTKTEKPATKATKAKKKTAKFKKKSRKKGA